MAADKKYDLKCIECRSRADRDRAYRFELTNAWPGAAPAKVVTLLVESNQEDFKAGAMYTVIIHGE